MNGIHFVTEVETDVVDNDNKVRRQIAATQQLVNHFSQALWCDSTSPDSTLPEGAALPVEQFAVAMTLLLSG
jgi:uncharacterized protein (UPF0303 family)